MITLVAQIINLLIVLIVVGVILLVRSIKSIQKRISILEAKIKDKNNSI